MAELEERLELMETAEPQEEMEERPVSAVDLSPSRLEREIQQQVDLEGQQDLVDHPELYQEAEPQAPAEPQALDIWDCMEVREHQEQVDQAEPEQLQELAQLVLPEEQ